MKFNLFLPPQAQTQKVPVLVAAWLSFRSLPPKEAMVAFVVTDILYILYVVYVFNLFLPPQAQTQKVPVLIYLSGLTCTAENCSEKGFGQGQLYFPSLCNMITRFDGKR
jgi:S-formylglutathione hydrolase FrmB